MNAPHSRIEGATRAILRNLAARTGFTVRLLNPLRLLLDGNRNALFERRAA